MKTEHFSAPIQQQVLTQNLNLFPPLSNNCLRSNPKVGETVKEHQMILHYSSNSFSLTLPIFNSYASTHLTSNFQINLALIAPPHLPTAFLTLKTEALINSTLILGNLHLSRRPRGGFKLPAPKQGHRFLTLQASAQTYKETSTRSTLSLSTTPSSGTTLPSRITPTLPLSLPPASSPHGRGALWEPQCPSPAYYSHDAPRPGLRLPAAHGAAGSGGA